MSHMETKIIPTQIDMQRVWDLYDKVLNVEEYYHPWRKWTTYLPTGTQVSDPDLYVSTDVDIFGDRENQIDPIRARVVCMCIEADAVKICFRCRDKKGDECFPEYTIEELIKKST